jgi:hypothetical protein
MTKRFIVFTCWILFGASTCFAQSDTTGKKLFDHYIGVQANQLFRQILNLSNSSTAIDNPYLLTYRLIHNKTGFGINAGGGITYTFSQNLLQSAIENTTTDYAYRIGINRRSMLGKWLELFFGIDYINKSRLSTTTVAQVTIFGPSSQDSTVTKTTTTKRGHGLGPQVALHYNISPHFQIGTEATLYYIESSSKENVFFSEVLTSQGQTEYFTDNTNTEFKDKSFSLLIPVALFIHIKF